MDFVVLVQKVDFLSMKFLELQEPGMICYYLPQNNHAFQVHYIFLDEGPRTFFLISTTIKQRPEVILRSLYSSHENESNVEETFMAKYFSKYT